MGILYTEGVVELIQFFVYVLVVLYILAYKLL